MSLAPKTNISKLSPNKRKLLRPLLQESWTETYANELGETTTNELIVTLASDDIGGLAPNKDETIFIASNGDHIVGCAVSAERLDVTYLWGCYVLAQYQRHGIGRALMQQAVSAGRSTGIIQITVLKSSAGAVKFYEALGFTTSSEEEFQIVPDRIVPAIIMRSSKPEFKKRS